MVDGGFRQGKEALLGSFKGQVFLVYLDVALRKWMFLKGTSPSVMDQLGKLQRPHYDLTGIMISKGNHLQIAFTQNSWTQSR